MTFARKLGGGNVTPTTVKRKQGGVWANVQTVKRRSGGAWVTVWTAYIPVTASVDRTSTTGSKVGTAPNANVSSLPVTAGGTGGSGSYTYSWERVSGATMSLSGPNAASTTFTANVPINGVVTAVYRCKVSDGTTSAYTPNVNISLDYSSPN